MPLSPEAIKNDQNSGLPLVKVKKIFADTSFNCRGQFGAVEVVDIARDIAKRGLVEPIIIRHLWDGTQDHLKKQGFEYSLVAGFRRHYAYRVNEADVIPCIVREINSDFDCRDLNAVENLQRLDLNLLQEAKSIQHYINAGWTRDEIGKRVSKSPGWVQLRQMLLECPEEIQLACAQGYILQDDLKEIYKHRKNRNEMLRLGGIIRDKRKMGQKRDILKNVKKPIKKYELKQRRQSDMRELMDTIREMCKKADLNKQVSVGDLISDQGNSLMTRVLAWTTGCATNNELYAALEKFAGVVGSNYKSPELVND